MSGGGGGGSGSISYPAYLETLHSNFVGNGTLTTSMTAAVTAAQGANPFSSFVVYNPTGDMSEIRLAFNKFQKNVDSFDPYAEMDNILDKVRSVSPAVIAETGIRKVHLKAVARYAAWAGGIGAQNTTSYDFALADMLSDYEDAVIRQTMGETNGLIAALITLKQNELELKRIAVTMLDAINQNKVRAEMGYREKKAEIAAKSAMWSIDVCQPLANAIASIGGGTVDPNKVTYTETAMDQVQLETAQFALQQAKKEAKAAEAARQEAYMQQQGLLRPRYI